MAGVDVGFVFMVVPPVRRFPMRTAMPTIAIMKNRANTPTMAKNVVLFKQMLFAESSLSKIKN